MQFNGHIAAHLLPCFRGWRGRGGELRLRLRGFGGLGADERQRVLVWLGGVLHLLEQPDIQNAQGAGDPSQEDHRRQQPGNQSAVAFGGLG